MNTFLSYDISTTLPIFILTSFWYPNFFQGAVAACGLRGHMRSRGAMGRHGPRVPRRLFGNMEQLNPSLVTARWIWKIEEKKAEIIINKEWGDFYTCSPFCLVWYIMFDCYISEWLRATKNIFFL